VSRRPEAGPAEPAEPVAEACDMNLGPRQRIRRLRLGLIMGIVAVIATVLAFNRGVGALERLLIVPIVQVAALGFLQYRAKT
jgi:hypothetical protein